MERDYKNGLAYKCWRLGGPPFLAPRAALSTWETLRDAIQFKLLDRWRRRRISFRDRARDPIGVLLDNVEIRLPKARAVVRARSATDVDYGNWQVMIDDGRRTRNARLPTLNPRRVLEDPEAEIQVISWCLAAEIHSSLEGAAARPYRPVPPWFMSHMGDVRAGCVRYEEQFSCLPYRVILSAGSWSQLQGPTVVDWVDSRGVARSTPVVLVPELEEQDRIEVVSEAYINAAYSSRDLVSAVGYTPERHAAQRRARAAEKHTETVGSAQLLSASIERATWRQRISWKAMDVFEMMRGPLKKAARVLTSPGRRRRALAEMDRYAFVGRYAHLYLEPQAEPGYWERGPRSAMEIIERLPLSSLPIPVRATVSGAAGDLVELAFFARSGETQRVLTLPATGLTEVTVALIEEAHSVIQEQRGYQFVEAICPRAEEPLSVIRDLALEYDLTYQQAASGLVISMPAWAWLCLHRERQDRITFSTQDTIHSLPLYVTGNWGGGYAFQVASEQRIARQMAKGEILPLSDVPLPVRRSFEACGLEAEGSGSAWR